MIDDAKQKPGPRRPHRRSRHAIVGQCEAQPIAARLGADLLAARRSLRLTQAGLFARRYQSLRDHDGIVQMGTTGPSTTPSGGVQPLNRDPIASGRAKLPEGPP